MSEHVHVPDERLHALIDGELTAGERADLETVVAADPYLGQRVALFRADKARLAGMYESLLEQPLPPQWLSQIERHRASSPRRQLFSIEAIAGIAAAIMLTVGGTLYYEQSRPHEETIVAEALAARSDEYPVQRKIAVNAPAEGVAVGRVLSATFSMKLSAPDLRRMGYRLIGAHLYSNVPGGKAAELLYKNKENRTFALYVRHSSGTPRFDQFKQGRLRVCIWQDDVIGAVMSGEMSAAEMQRLASLAYSGLEA
jgi:anti-sigma factor RsiW